MTTTGPNYAGAVGTNGYVNPSNAVGSGESSCAGPNSGTTLVTGFWNTFGFTIPTDVTINGILVETKDSRSGPGGVGADVDVNIGVNEATLGTAIAESTVDLIACGEDQPIHSFGGSSNLWGLSWTAADINSSSFTVRIQKSVLGGNFGHRINWIRVTVDFTAPLATRAKKSITTKGSMSSNTRGMILSRSRMK